MRSFQHAANKTLPAILSTAIVLLVGLSPSAPALPPQEGRSCAPASAGQECELNVDLSFVPVVGWQKSQSDPAWDCTPPPGGPQEEYDAGCTIQLAGGLPIICVAVEVHARAAGVGSIRVTGHCDPVPYATCTATTNGPIGVGTCSDADAHAGLLPAKCKVKAKGAVAGDGECKFLFAVF